MSHDGAVRGLVATCLAIGAACTSASLLGAPESATVAAAGQSAGPLDGTWRSVANGDRVNRLERRGNQLWSATDGGGLVLWNLSDGSFVQYLAPQDGLGANVVYDVAIGRDGTVWAATERGLSRMAAGADRFTNLTAVELPGMPSRVVTAIAPLADGRLWLGFGQEWDPTAVDPKTRQKGVFRPGGLALFDPATGVWSHETHAKVIEYFGSDGERYESIPSENVTDVEIGSDGLVWVGTRQYHRWDPNEFNKVDPSAPPGFWVLAGGGLAAFNGANWKNWVPTESGTGCYTYHISDLEPDVEGRMWAATAGKGLLVMRDGLDTGGCGRGMALYLRSRRDISPGLESNQVWSVDIDERGRVWVGNDAGGVDVLDHNGTFEDSSISAKPWQTDDLWTHLRLDDDLGDSTTALTALWVRDPGIRFVGTKELHSGDGDGVRRFDPATNRWWPLRTSASGIPSNQIASIARDPATGDMWFAFRHAGIARYDGRAWRWWRAFGAGRQVAAVKQDVPADPDGTERIPVTIATKAEYDAAFPSSARYARFGEDPTLYRVVRYAAERNGSGPFVDVKPATLRGVPAGTPVYVIDRGPPANESTQVVADVNGRIWAGGLESMWLGTDCPSDRARLGECWQDGGLGKWDGAQWNLYWQHELGPGANTIPDQEVRAVEVGLDGRVWVGTGDDGIGVFDPAKGLWVAYSRENTGPALGSNGVWDLDVDPETGDVWAAHRSAAICAPSPDGGPCTPSRGGGGVSRFDGERWRAWTKPGASLRAFGAGGEMSSIAVDRGRGLVWAGGYDGDEDTLHWPTGYGINAALNWCPIDCENDRWQSQVWVEDGEVAALALDQDGNLWAGLHRSGYGITPPQAGVRLFDGATWHTYTPANAGLVSNEITTLEAVGDNMWVGTLRDGVSVYAPAPPATPTPTGDGTPTAEPTPTVTDGTPIGTPTPTDDRSTATPVPATPTATATTWVDRPHRVYAPFLERRVRSPAP